MVDVQSQIIWEILDLYIRLVLLILQLYSHNLRINATAFFQTQDKCRISEYLHLAETHNSCYA